MSGRRAPSRAARTPADDARSLRAGTRRRRRVAGGRRAGRRGLVRRPRQLVGARAGHGGRPVARGRRPHRRDRRRRHAPRRRRHRRRPPGRRLQPGRDGRPARRRAHARTGRCPASWWRACRSSGAAGARSASRSSTTISFLDVGAKDGDELRSSCVPATRRSGTARRSRWPATASPRGRSTTGSAVTSRSRRRDGSRSGAGPRRLHRRRRRAGGGRRLRRLAHRRVRHRAAGRARGRRHARERRPRRRSGGRGQGRPRRRPDAVARPVDPSRRLRAPPRDRRGGGDPVRGRGLARHDEHRRRRRLPQPPRHRHGSRLGAAPLHALAGRDRPTSRTSSGRCSSSSRSRAGSSLDSTSRANLGA